LDFDLQASCDCDFGILKFGSCSIAWRPCLKMNENLGHGFAFLENKPKYEPIHHIYFLYFHFNFTFYFALDFGRTTLCASG
jgi:hypothetical protein